MIHFTPTAAAKWITTSWWETSERIRSSLRTVSSMKSSSS